MAIQHELPEELVEHLERYCEGRCPALAACLLEELAVRSVHAETEEDRCTFSSLLRHWLGVDRSRIDEPIALLRSVRPNKFQWNRLSIVKVEKKPGRSSANT